MCGFYCITFIEYMLPGITLLDYTYLFSSNDYQKNDKIIYDHFKNKYGRRNKFRVQINNLSDEIKHNDLMSEKYKRTCKYFNYVENLLILTSAVTGCVSISVFASLVDAPVGITSSAVGIKICAITTGIKKYKSTIKKEEKA